MRGEDITRRPRNVKYPVLASNARFPDFGYCKGSPNKSDRRVLLPASGLQHVGFVQAAYCETLHRSLQIFTDFK